MDTDADTTSLMVTPELVAEIKFIEDGRLGNLIR
jgi:hypothetical protein